jgi:hypothetical protein
MIRSIAHDQPQKNFKYLWLDFRWRDTPSNLAFGDHVRLKGRGVEDSAMKKVLLGGLLLTAIMCSGSATAAATSTDGTYTGTLTCDPLPTTTRLRVKLSMAVEQGRVSYEREILQQGKNTGRFERGTGTVSETGDVAVKGWGATPSMKFDAEYKGRITGDRIQLEGTQQWQDAGSVHTRSCQIDLSR